MKAAVRKFWREHAKGGASHVVMVQVCDASGLIQHAAVFSTIETAMSWADHLPDHNQGGACVFVPMVVDVPEFGNVPAKQRH